MVMANLSIRACNLIEGTACACPLKICQPRQARPVCTPYLGEDTPSGSTQLKQACLKGSSSPKDIAKDQQFGSLKGVSHHHPLSWLPLQNTGKSRTGSRKDCCSTIWSIVPPAGNVSLRH
ncbi:hypothetical protein PGT21_017800 [Puccinia graminis f. sp. tritici]|uniref:Uncharacterized protein n=1 Tax=Puccinia graminis f. sp. tritici TaxID=56615 RepID=A0A5B0QNG1_PUCGR|nr:hypothetical protein PGT21_017800 [Puccinia graminis f. sp. tritici]